MRPIVAVIPSYNASGWLARTVDGCRRVVQPDALLVLDQPAGHPLGSGEARRRLCEQTVAEYGPDCLILSLDDDCTFTPGVSDSEHIRWAGEHFDEDPTVGIVQLVNSSKPPTDKHSEAALLYHVFLISGRLVAEGCNYDPHEYGDEIDLSLRAWFAGWRLLRTGRARVRHHVTSRYQQRSDRGGREAAFQAGLTPVRCTFVERYLDTGLTTANIAARDGVLLPTPYHSIHPTAKGRAAHAAAYAARWSAR